MDDQNSSLTRYQREINLIREELARFTHVSVIEALVAGLAMPKENQRAVLMRMPWAQFFLLKLALTGPGGKRVITQPVFSDIATRLYNLQHLAVDFSNSNIMIEVRPMLMQQSWYQRSELDLLRQILRQRMFFASRGGWYTKEFAKITGVSLRNFFLITFLIHLQFRTHELTALHINLVSLLFHVCPGIAVQEVFNYFRLIGTRVADLPAFFASHILSDTPVSEYFQDTPLRSKPVFIEESRLLAVDHTLFLSGMAEFVPELMKKVLKSGFKDKFGPDFQSYVGRLLSRLDGVLLDDTAVNALYRANGWAGQNADFVLIGSDTVLVVECKALEPGPIVRSKAEPGTLNDHLKQDFNKAPVQISRTANLMASLSDYAGHKFYGVVVTHSDFGMFDAGWVSDLISPKVRVDISRDFPNSVIELNEIIYCAVNDIEDICRAHHFGKFDMFEVVAEAVAKQADAKTMSFVFQQVLAGRVAGLGYPPSEILDELDDLETQINQLVKHNRKRWANDVGGLLRMHEVVIEALNTLPSDS
ncbi:hypothetical protein IB234_15220 [Pseudomonas sp. PDM16]|uniref:hypothetical protein n=1 Tax=Pseudomonas sp. PDM16 TaxID=2769292 RepID=UPI00177F6E4C|nr:hypothetical protein [Pseudomonas sp. PDM16]MBD9415912.1 hypothetical protein [Pseudomonas sp. PDM16]